MSIRLLIHSYLIFISFISYLIPVGAHLQQVITIIVSHGGETRRLSIAAPRWATRSPAAQVMWTSIARLPQCADECVCSTRHTAQPIGCVPGAARSAPQSRGLWLHWSLSRGVSIPRRRAAPVVGRYWPRREGGIGISCFKPAGRRCWVLGWVATAGDCA